MTRRESRENIFKIVFQTEFHDKNEFDNEARLFLELADGMSDKDRDYILNKSADIVKRVDELDAIVNSSAEKWKTSRMGKTELAIIRLAVYEMKFDDDIPEAVAINEAVELAKEFGSDQSPSFVNGILAKLAGK